MKPLTRAQSRDVDRHAIEELKVPSIVLMENAGRGAAEVLLEKGVGSLFACANAEEVIGESKKDSRPLFRTLILCGKGNNGGDGFVIARHLAIRGVAVQIALLAPRDELTGDTRTNFEIVERMQLPLLGLSSAADLRAQLTELIRDVDWIVDAMLGTGATGEPREPFRTVIEWVNKQSASKLAVDLPSGLDCDTGQPSVATVRADVTCTFHAPKVGFLQPSAAEVLGELHVISIGIPAEIGGA